MNSLLFSLGILLNLAPVMTNEVPYIRVPAGTLLVGADGEGYTGHLYVSEGTNRPPVQVGIPDQISLSYLTANTGTFNRLVLTPYTTSGLGTTRLQGSNLIINADGYLQLTATSGSDIQVPGILRPVSAAARLGTATYKWPEIHGTTIYGTTFSGGGGNLTGLNATNMTAGTISTSRLPEAVILDTDIGVTVQAYDSDLDDLADGSLSGSKVGTGIAAGNITSGTIPTTVLPWAGTYSGSTATRGTAWVNDRLTFGGLVLDSGQLTPGSGAYGVGLEWTTISTDSILRKKASIVPRQYGADVDQLGLDVFASGTTGAGDLMLLAIRIQGSSVYFPGSVTFSNGLTVAGGAISGAGSGITALNGSAITSGTIATNYLPMDSIGGGSGTVDDDVLVNGTGVDTAADFQDTTTIEWALAGANPGTVTAVVASGSIGATQIDESSIEGVLDLADLQGAVTDSQVPDNITLGAAGAFSRTNWNPSASTFINVAGDLTLSIQGDIIADADILPADDDTQSLGSVAYRWQNIHALTGTIENVAAGFGVFSDLLTADAFSGNGADLTALPAAELTGTIPVAVRHPAYKEVISSSHTLTASECYNGAKYWVTAAATLTLPPVAEDMEIIVIADGANAVSVDANAADRIKLDGTALDDGDKITSDGTAGAVVVLSYRDADGWYATTDGLWSDGGP